MGFLASARWKRGRKKIGSEFTGCSQLRYLTTIPNGGPGKFLPTWGENRKNMVKTKFKLVLVPDLGFNYDNN